MPTMELDHKVKSFVLNQLSYGTLVFINDFAP